MYTCSSQYNTPRAYYRFKTRNLYTVYTPQKGLRCMQTDSASNRFPAGAHEAQLSLKYAYKYRILNYNYLYIYNIIIAAGRRTAAMDYVRLYLNLSLSRRFRPNWITNCNNNNNVYIVEHVCRCSKRSSVFRAALKAVNPHNIQSDCFPVRLRRKFEF